MATPLSKFSTRCGENIELSDDQYIATWKPKESAGWIYSKEPLKPGQKVTVVGEGSGHYELGFVCENPEDIDLTSGMTPSFKQLNDVKIHKKTCSITSTLNEFGTEMVNVYNQKTYKKGVENDTKIWVTVLTTFGDVSIKIYDVGMTEDHGNVLSLSKNYGKNIKLEAGSTQATTIKKNPASVCFIEKPLKENEVMLIQCQPVAESRRQPSRYHVTLNVCEKDPKILPEKFDYLFSTKYEILSEAESPFTRLECFEKDVCVGNIQIKRLNATTIEYCNGKGKRLEQKLDSSMTGDIWVVFDTYRVQLKIINHNLNCLDDIDGQHSENVQSLSLNENEENSLDSYLDPMVQSPQHERPARTSAGDTVDGVASEQTIPKHLFDGDERADIQTHYTKLVNDLIPIETSDHMFERNMISCEEMSRIHNAARQSSAQEANRQLLQLIRKRHVKFINLRPVLESTGQTHLLKYFFPNTTTGF